MDENRFRSPLAESHRPTNAWDCIPDRWFTIASILVYLAFVGVAAVGYVNRDVIAIAIVANAILGCLALALSSVPLVRRWRRGEGK